MLCTFYGVGSFCSRLFFKWESLPSGLFTVVGPNSVGNAA